MAFNQEWIDRYKAVGFYRHVEWERKRGVLVKIHNPDQYNRTLITFESGSHDTDYDQKFDGYRQLFMSRQAAVKMMLNLGFNITKITAIFKRIDGMQVIEEFV